MSTLSKYETFSSLGTFFFLFFFSHSPSDDGENVPSGTEVKSSLSKNKIKKRESLTKRPWMRYKNRDGKYHDGFEADHDADTT